MSFSLVNNQGQSEYVLLSFDFWKLPKKIITYNGSKCITKESEKLYQNLLKIFARGLKS